MKIHPGKVLNLIVIYITFIIGILTIYFQDTLKRTRNELTQFYESKLDSCKIIRTILVNYPSRGQYEIFYTDCNNDFYPVILKKGTPDVVYNLFSESSYISKDKNSLAITIYRDRKIYNLKLGNPKDEDDRKSDIILCLFFMTVATVLILNLPDSEFDYLNGKKRNSDQKQKKK